MRVFSAKITILQDGAEGRSSSAGEEDDREDPPVPSIKMWKWEAARVEVVGVEWSA